MSSSIHEDVKAALDDLHEEAADLEHVAGHELVKLYNALRATVNAIQAAKRGQEYTAPEIKAGLGAIEDPLHPETAAAEAQPESADDLRDRAAREPDPVVREKIEAAAVEREAAEAEPVAPGPVAEDELPPPPPPPAPEADQPADPPPPPEQ